MKFFKKYQDYLQNQEKELPALGFKNLKKILKTCKKEFESNQELQKNGSPSVDVQRCSVCDGIFFPPLLSEISAIVGSFKERAQKLLELHLASGLRKYFKWCLGKYLNGNHIDLMQEGKDLVIYGLINHTAVRKLLKKYDKVCFNQDQALRSQAQSMHIEILQSPWLRELMAFHINLRETKIKSESEVLASADGFSLTLDDNDKPSLSYELFDSIKLDTDLTCSICLDTVFDPVSLTCGHIFCYMCACSAASVTTVDGLKAAKPTEKCPLCREAGVYENAVHLEELNTLLSRSCPEYWEQRLQSERAERVQQAKEHWESQSRAFLGI